MPKDVEIFVDLHADLVVYINQLLREKNLSQKELADKLGKQPSEISKWLSSEHNFTLRSLAKLSAELGEPLLKVPKRKKQSLFIYTSNRSVRTFTVSKKTEVTKVTEVTPWQPTNEFNLLSNVG
jgi:transcriptional regulator with XRE-family HTH domain